jgi:ribosomal protein S18 acetylase RimI-like enzyme
MDTRPLHGIHLRPFVEEDLPFIFSLYASTRMAEMALTGWPQEQVQAFLIQQFQAQHHHYQTYYPGGLFAVIERDGEPIGRWYVRSGGEEARLIDVTLRPADRNRGIGSLLMEGLQREARDRGLPIRLHVEPFNPAYRLYQRFGFTLLEERGVYHFLEWKPDRSGPRGQPKTAS